MFKARVILRTLSTLRKNCHTCHIAVIWIGFIGKCIIVIMIIVMIMISNGNRTEKSPIRSVIIRVIRDFKIQRRNGHENVA